MRLSILLAMMLLSAPSVGQPAAPPDPAPEPAPGDAQPSEAAAPAAVPAPSAPPAQPPPTQPPPTQPPPAQYGQPGYGPPYGQPGYGPPPAYGQPGYGPPPGYGAPGYGRPAPPPEPPRPPRSGMVGVGRIGFIVGGSGDAGGECSGSGCGVASGSSADYDDKSNLVLGGDLMGHLSPQFRLGGGLLFVPDTSFEDDRGSDLDAGSDLSLQAIVEGVFDISPTVALTLRGQGGALFLFPGGDLSDAIDELKASCDSIPVNERCEVKDGPFVGWTFGGAFGVLFAAGTVAIRADLTLQWYDIDTIGQKATVNGADLDTTFNFAGNRVILGGGVEF